MIKVLFISGFLSLALWSCDRNATQQKVKFEEPKREQCYRECLGSYKGNAESAYKKCFRVASEYTEGRSCFGGHGL